MGHENLSNIAREDKPLATVVSCLSPTNRYSNLWIGWQHRKIIGVSHSVSISFSPVPTVEILEVLIRSKSSSAAPCSANS